MTIWQNQNLKLMYFVSLFQAEILGSAGAQPISTARHCTHSNEEVSKKLIPLFVFINLIYSVLIIFDIVTCGIVRGKKTHYESIQ